MRMGAKNKALISLYQVKSFPIFLSVNTKWFLPSRTATSASRTILSRPFFKLSVGYKQFPHTNALEGELIVTPKESVTVGLGLELKGVHLDYAYEESDHIEFKHKHYFSMGLSF